MSAKSIRPRFSVPKPQLDRMLSRYAAVIDERFTIMGETYGDAELERARGAIDVARETLAVPNSDYADVRHLVGVIQGILLCKGIHTWEYLATDDRRE